MTSQVSRRVLLPTAILLLAAGSLCGATLEDTIVADGAVIYWRLDESDKSSGETAFNLGSAGAAGDATYVGSVANVTDPIITSGGNAAGFSSGGDNDRVRLTGFGSMPTTAITAAGWVRGSAASNSEATIYSYDVAGQGNEFLLINQGGNWRIFVDGTTAITSVTEAEVLDGEWHHLAVTWDSSTGDANFYLDAVLEDTVNLELGTSLATGGTWVLGQEQDGLDTGYNASQRLIGDLDEFAIFDSVLSQSQILRQFNIALGIPEPSSVAIWILLGLGGVVFCCWRRGVRPRKS